MTQPELESKSSKFKSIVFGDDKKRKRQQQKETERAPGPDGKVCDLASKLQVFDGAHYFPKVMWPFRNSFITMATSFQVSFPWQFIGSLYRSLFWESTRVTADTYIAEKLM